MRQFLTRLSVTFTAIFLYAVSVAQPKTDSSKAPMGGSRPSSGPKPYKEIITSKAATDEGLFAVHKVDEKYYLEIADSMFGREILVVNRISKAAAGMRNGFFGYAGDQVGQNVIRF